MDKEQENSTKEHTEHHEEAHHNPKHHSGLSKKDMGWMFSFLGTAIGAGILFLPLQAGIGGFYVLIVATLLAFPICLYSQKFFATMILTSEKIKGYTEVTKDVLGEHIGVMVSLLYFIIFLVVLIAYSIAINNDMGKFLIHSHILTTNISRNPISSFVIIFALLFAIALGEHALLRVMEIVTVPMLILILGISFYLIPHWNLSYFSHIPTIHEFIKNLLLVLPILILSVLYFPALSTMIMSYRHEMHNIKVASKKIYRVIGISQVLLMFFMFIFIASTILTISPSDIAVGFKENISALSLLSTTTNIGIIEYIAPIISLLALVSSFLGVFLATREGIKSLLMSAFKHHKRFREKDLEKIFNYNEVDYAITFSIGGFLWSATILNFSVEHLLGFIIAPAIAILLCLIPYFIYRKLKKERNIHYKIANFILISGVFMLVSFLIGEFI